MRFSIIIPNYNSEKWIEQCLKSILNQTYINYEIIIVDDISTDNSVDIIKKLLRPEDKLIVNKTKRLNGGTRNVGIMEATGDYILCIDCDDWLADNNVLEDINNKLNGEDIMFLGYKCKGKTTECDLVFKYDSLDKAYKDIPIAPWTRCIKREIMQDTLFPEGTLFEDRIWHYQLIPKIKTFTNLGRISHIWNRTNEDSISENEDKYIQYIFEYCGELYRLIPTIQDEDRKQFVINELKGYIDSCKGMVDKL